MSKAPEGKSVLFIRQLNTMICAKMAVWVVTQEEERFLRLFRKIAERHHRNNLGIVDTAFQVMSWSITEGLMDLMPQMVQEHNVYRIPVKVTSIQKKTTALTQQEQALGIKPSDPKASPIVTFEDFYNYAMSNSTKKVYIIKDIHNLLNPSRGDYAVMVRYIKDLIFHIRTNHGFLIFLSPTARTCIDFEKDIQILKMPRPDEIDINALLDEALSDMTDSIDLRLDINYTKNKKEIKSKHPQAAVLRDRIVQNLRGLTETEISQIIAYTCVKNLGLEENALTEIKDSKKQIIEKSGALQYIEVPTSIGVGGHEQFKQYIAGRGLYLDKETRDFYHLKAPKGVLLVGVSGSGKSLLARYCGFQWNIPVIRLNFASVFGKYLGESEDNLNNALDIAEANAPCILWIDELEKALGGSGSGDSGTGLRILGKVLTWMQEREEMVFMFATANNVSRLPPELTRPGRFDAKFWADLPSITECKDIFEIKTKENGFKLEFLDLMKLANQAFEKQMTGAEIEHAVIQGVYAAAVSTAGEKGHFKQPVTADFISNAMADIHSHAISHAEDLTRDRLKALEDYTFTSEEVRDKIVKDNKEKFDGRR